MLLPELPGYLSNMGAHHLIGWIVALFTIGAFVSRFVAGRVADRAGRKPVMLFGTAVTALAGFAYIGVARMESVAMAVTGFLIVRLLHGLSTGFRPTGTSAFLTDLAPPDRRGEAFGYLGVAGNAGMALGPALGSWLAVEFGYDAMFLASSALGVAAYAMTTLLPETLRGARKPEWQDLNVLEGGTVEPSAWPSSVFLLPVAIAFGTFLTVTPDLVADLGFKYKGSFNTVVVAASIGARLVAGKASDRYGRVELLMLGAVLLAIGMTLFSAATSVTILLVAGVVYGFSIGINMPAIFAWTIDLAPAREELATAIAEADIQAPRCPIYQNVSAEPTSDPDLIRQQLVAQLTAPVRWTQTMHTMIADGASEVTEVGPGKVLQGLFKKVDRAFPTVSAGLETA